MYIPQEAVTWSLEVDRFIPLSTKLFVYFLALSCLWGVVCLVKSAWITSRWPSTKRGKLIELQQTLEAGDRESAATLTSKLPKKSPESGLAEFDAQISSAHLHILSLQSDLTFRHALAPLLAAATHLKNFTILLLLTSAAWTAYQVTNIFQFISANKIMAISAVFGGLREATALLCVGLVIAVAFHLIRWRLTSLLTRRQNLWDSIKSHLEMIAIRSL